MRARTPGGSSSMIMGRRRALGGLAARAGARFLGASAGAGAGTGCRPRMVSGGSKMLRRLKKPPSGAGCQIKPGRGAEGSPAGSSRRGIIFFGRLCLFLTVVASPKTWLSSTKLRPPGVSGGADDLLFRPTAASGTLTEAPGGVAPRPATFSHHPVLGFRGGVNLRTSRAFAVVCASGEEDATEVEEAGM